MMNFFKKNKTEKASPIVYEANVNTETGDVNINTNIMEGMEVKIETEYTDKDLYDFYLKLKNLADEHGMIYCSYVYDDGTKLGLKQIRAIRIKCYTKKDERGYYPRVTDYIEYSRYYYCNYECVDDYRSGNEHRLRSDDKLTLNNLFAFNEDVELTFVSMDEFVDKLKQLHSDYVSSFKDADISQPRYYFGVIKEMSQFTGLYAIKIDGKIIERDRCYVAYSVSDMIHCPNYWYHMPMKEWYEFDRCYSTEKPEYFVLNN